MSTDLQRPTGPLSGSLDLWISVALVTQVAGTLDDNDHNGSSLISSWVAATRTPLTYDIYNAIKFRIAPHHAHYRP